MPSDSSQAPHDLVGASPAIGALRAEIAVAARTQANVLIIAERGTETETVARLIHAHSDRRDGPFLAAHCTGIPDTVLESHLLGHARGSFAGAFRDKRGLVQDARGGTLFVSDLGALSVRTQRALNQSLTDPAPVGDTPRIMVTVHQPLADLVDVNRFNPELVDRVNRIQIRVPPVRDRDHDVLLLLEHYFAHARPGDTRPTLTADAAEVVVAYSWPGNLHEVHAVAERLLARHPSGLIAVDDLPEEIRRAAPMRPLNRGVAKPGTEPVREIGHPSGYVRAVEPEMRGLYTRANLRVWIRQELSLAPEAERALVSAIDQVLLWYERVWRASKEDALRAVAAGFAQRLDRLRDELRARDATSRNVARYFEEVVAELTQRTHRDAKTQLLHFRRFMEHVEIGLSVDRRESWCALGVADITAFKTLNDTLGHAAGDRILKRVAELLRSEVRCSDLLGVQPQAPRAPALHARFGGDEFCFFLSDLDAPEAACAIAERFWHAVADYNWTAEDPRLATQVVTVDIGVACLQLGHVGDRHASAAGTIGDELFARADQCLYAVKRGTPTHIACEAVRIHDGHLLDIGPVFGRSQGVPGRDTA